MTEKLKKRVTEKPKKFMLDHWGKTVSLSAGVMILMVIMGVSDSRIAAVNTRIEDKHKEALALIDAKYDPLKEAIKRIDRRLRRR